MVSVHWKILYRIVYVCNLKDRKKTMLNSWKMIIVFFVTKLFSYVDQYNYDSSVTDLLNFSRIVHEKMINYVNLS
jgi:hypothetical protein